MGLTSLIGKAASQLTGGLSGKRKSKFAALTLAGGMAAAGFGALPAQAQTSTPGSDTHVVCGMNSSEPDIIQQTVRNSTGPSVRLTYFLYPATQQVRIEGYTDHAKRFVETGDFQHGITSMRIEQRPDFNLGLNINGVRTAEDKARFDEANSRLQWAFNVAAQRCSTANASSNFDALPLVRPNNWDGIRVERTLTQLGDWRFVMDANHIHGENKAGWQIDATGPLTQFPMFVKNGNMYRIDLRGPGFAQSYYPNGGYLIESTPGRYQSSGGQPIPQQMQEGIQKLNQAIRASSPILSTIPLTWFPTTSPVRAAPQAAAPAGAASSSPQP